MRRAAVDPVLVGLEHEYRVHDGDTRVDFRTLIHRIGFAGVRADPADPNAYRLPWGGVVTCDGREAEIAIPPVPLRGGFTGRVAQLVAAGHQALECQLPDGHALSGYSTHLSVSAPRRGDCRLARRYASTFAPALMLLMDRADSPGLLVRPRPGRLELCGEYVRGPQLRGALAFAAGSAMAAGAANRRALNALRIDVALAPAVERYGWYVDRSAFGVDLYHGGRDTHLRRLRGGTITAQDHLEATWTIARDALAPSANLIDLAATDALVNARAPLPLEQPCDQPIDECGDHLGAAETSAGVDIGPRVRRRFIVRVHLVTWTFTVFVVEAARGRVFVSLPRDAVVRFLTDLDHGRLDDQLVQALANPPRTRLEHGDQTQAAGIFGSVGDPAALLPAERDPVSGRLIPNGGGGAGGLRPRPGKRSSHEAAPPPARLPARTFALVGAAVIAVIAVVAIAAVALSGGGSSKKVSTANRAPTATPIGPTATVSYVGSSLVSSVVDPPGAPIAIPALPVECSTSGCALIDPYGRIPMKGNAFQQTVIHTATAPNCPATWVLTVVYDLQATGTFNLNGVRFPGRLTGTISLSAPRVDTSPTHSCTGITQVSAVDATPTG